MPRPSHVKPRFARRAGTGPRVDLRQLLAWTHARQRTESGSDPRGVGSKTGRPVTGRAELARSAAWFRQRHRGPGVLVLPNAWDASSARLVEEAGFEAVATTSAGIAASLGCEDHEALSPDEMFHAVARIAAVVSVPITADLESGYGLGPAELVERALAAGVVGMNIEDTDHRTGGLADPQAHAARLAAIKEAGNAAGVDLVVNARVDVFLVGSGSPDERLAEAIRRGRLYREAGADCLFPILLEDERLIRRFVEGVTAPVNILALPNGPALSRLAGIGVARVSYGSRLHGTALQGARDFLDRLRAEADAG
jgi:2-methylisocitrate lyase-like PEP mutase family enzyme